MHMHGMNMIFMLPIVVVGGISSPGPLSMSMDAYSIGSVFPIPIYVYVYLYKFYFYWTFKDYLNNMCEITVWSVNQ